MDTMEAGRQGQGAGQNDYLYFAERGSPEYDEVVLQADYCARATLSFWRFRQLGGGRFRRRRTGNFITWLRAGGPLSWFRSSTESEIVQGRPQVGETYKEGVYYVSDHPQVRTLNLSVIALLVLFESAANAYFFAQQSEFGLSGGIFQAAAVSLANVAVSYFIVGFWGLRHSTMPWTWDSPDRRHWIKLFGIFAVIAGVTLALLVNFSAAHYRNILETLALNSFSLFGSDSDALARELPNLEKHTVLRFPFISENQCNVLLGDVSFSQSIGSAATNAMCRPFSLYTLDAIVLFALGVAISALAAFEGRRADASFPGLSDAARHLEGARRDLQYALKKYYENYDDVIETVEENRKNSAKEDDGNIEHKLKEKERIALIRALDKRVEKYKRLLSSDPDLLRDEFSVPDEAVERLTGDKCEIEDREKNPSGDSL